MPTIDRTRGWPRGPATEVASNERHEAPLRALPAAHGAAAVAESPKGDFPPFVAAVSTAALQAHASSFNANGEQTGRTLGGTAYSLSYDYDGQLTQITQGQTTTDFAYDALGRRFSRTAGGSTTEFLYGAGGMALEKQGGSYTQAYTQANGLLRRGSEYPLFDGHGSERTVTNSSQTVTGSVNYEAFGQVVGTTGSGANPYMYAGDWGYRNDGDAGLMHVGARYYDAQVGRFITRDTVLSEHRYLYCEHEPVGAVDPSGDSPLAIAVAVAGGVSYWFGNAADDQGWEFGTNIGMVFGDIGVIGAGAIAVVASPAILPVVVGLIAVGGGSYWLSKHLRRFWYGREKIL
ncbi:MAG: RHS repeat-associated core domain-containing protein [Armatimonadetes bacterium]|nr:RHS repeat-associated core domain-containing protein [Armatimonadota bacterium]